MTVTTTYECDVCESGIDPSDWSNELQCVSSWGISTKGDGGVRFVPMARALICRRHICLACAKSIAFEWTRMQPAPQDGGKE